MKKVATEKATLEQLRAFAVSTLGIEINPNCNRLSALAQVQQSWDKPEIDVDDEAPAPVAKKAAAKVADKPAAKGRVRKVTVIIHATNEPGGADRVPLAVNGKAMLVERVIEQELPEHFYEVLQNAVQKLHDPLPDGKGYNPIPRLVPLYPHSVIRGPE